MMIPSHTDDAGTEQGEQMGHASWVLGDVLASMKGLTNASYRLAISSPPYNIGKVYERDQARSLAEYVEWQDEVIGVLSDKISDDGSVCWQVGNFVRNNEVVPLDAKFYDLFARRGFKLRNRIIWRFNFGQNLDRRFSGRYETLLWFSKSDKYQFNLDPVRVPQIYPGKRHSATKSNKAGLPSGNPKGKNPSDYWEFSAERDFIDNPIWDIPNVKAGHPEKTSHPCQFPIELAERCVLALTQPGDSVLDPFVGVGASAIAAVKHGRNVTGIDKDSDFLDLARDRVEALRQGTLPMRPSGKPVRRPVETEKVSKIPAEWLAS